MPGSAPSHGSLLHGWLTLLALGLVSACGLGRAQAPRPDLAGKWDLVYEDMIDVEVRIGEEVQRARVGRSGGKVLLHDAGALVELKLDCKREDLICPSETLDTQLTLTNRMGDVNDDGDALLLSLHGEGEAYCRLLSGSAATARIESEGHPGDARFRAVVLTDGRVQTRFSARCAMGTGDSKLDLSNASITLSTAFSAVRR